jgi:hypothetical protein
MDSTSDSNSLLLALLVGGALYYFYQRSQAQAAQYGVQNNVIGDVENLAQEVTNTVENATMGSTRGERNNNPGNIRPDPRPPQTQWQGLSAMQTDSGFLQFDNVLYGIRALHVNLNSYWTKHNLNTITGIIKRWAPPQDRNNTAAYIAFVSQSMGVVADAQLDMTDLATMTALVHAIIMKENGADPYLSTGQLQQAMALSIS